MRSRRRTTFGRPGASAAAKYNDLVRRWRSRVLRRVRVVIVLAAGACAVAGNLVTGSPKFWLGMAAGILAGLYVAISESPPAHIEKWRTGSQGERATAKQLRALAREGWRIRHDLMRDGGTNFDHVLVGPPGVFLLDTKFPFGEATLEDTGVLRVRPIDDPDDDWALRGLIPRMRGAAAELKDRLESATGVRTWVQPVVVLWSKFPQRAVETGGVAFVHGSLLIDWLRGRSPSARRIDADRVTAYLATADQG